MVRLGYQHWRFDLYGSHCFIGSGESTVANQYWGGKNPAYPNNVNPLNPGLENFGNNLSVLVSTYYIPADKVALSPYKERF